MSTPTANRWTAFLVFLAYLAFVVYGSLVPFELRTVSFDQALESFAKIPYLDLDAGARADWVANILLYMPLAFFGCNWLIGMRSTSPLRHLSALLILGFCISVAIAVEFTQIFFAPRTVSLNDLLAETIGSVMGLVLFGLGRRRIAQVQDSFVQGGRESVIAAIVVFALLYIALSLFPYDFVISSDEFTGKLSSENVGWLLAGNCDALLRCIARQAGEAVAIAPLGILIAIVSRDLNYRSLFAAGAATGLLLETLQLLLVSGVSQGLSIFLRGAGLVLGAAIGRFLRNHGPMPVARLIRLLTPFLALPYLILLVAINGWFSAPWLSVHEALARLPEFRIMPFYYHYWTSESVAMISLTAQAGMYFPIGLAWWAMRSILSRKGLGAPLAPHGTPEPAEYLAAGHAGDGYLAVQVGRGHGPLLRGGSRVGTFRAAGAALCAAILSLAVELGKLFVPVGHPDPTNLLIAAASAAMACSLGNWMECVLSGGHSKKTFSALAPTQLARESPPIEIRSPKAETRWPPAHPVGILLSLIAAVLAVAGMLLYPVAKPWLCAALLGYGAVLWHWPRLSFFVVPALLPILDLSPFTGRLTIDEFDLVVLVSFVVLYIRFYGMRPIPWPNRWLPVSFVLLWASWLLASTRGLWPLPGMGGDIPISSHSPVETWLVGKGLLWALLFVPIMRRTYFHDVTAWQDTLRGGLVAGLVLASLFVFWERHVFVGLQNFGNDFRVTGTFSSMNTGGAYIEAYLAFAFPILVAAVLMTKKWTLRILGGATAGLVSYAMMVTFSRGGYAGLVMGLLPVALGLLMTHKETLLRRWLVLVGVVLASFAAAIPVLSGEFAQYRLARSGEDLSIRLSHWTRALDLMDDGPIAAFLGMGFGQYPLVYALRAEDVRPPGSYTVLPDGDNAYLRLGSGESVFLDQMVDIEPGEILTLSVRVRQPYGDASLGVNLCKKSILYSFECVGKRLEPEKQGHGWRTLSVELNAVALDAGGDWPYRTIKLSLGNPGTGGVIDVDDVSLKTKEGVELLSNGGFSERDTRWLFVSDQDLAWHIHQQAVEMYFAQGLLGLAALAVLLVGVGKILWPDLLAGSLGAAAFAGALSGFLTVGLLGSTMDTARLSMLFYLGAFSAAMLTRTPSRNARRQETHRDCA